MKTDNAWKVLWLPCASLVILPVWQLVVSSICVAKLIIKYFAKACRFIELFCCNQALIDILIHIHLSLMAEPCKVLTCSSGVQYFAQEPFDMQLDRAAQCSNSISLCFRSFNLFVMMVYGPILPTILKQNVKQKKNSQLRHQNLFTLQRNGETWQLLLPSLQVKLTFWPIFIRKFIA